MTANLDDFDLLPDTERRNVWAALVDGDAEYELEQWRCHSHPFLTGSGDADFTAEQVRGLVDALVEENADLHHKVHGADVTAAELRTKLSELRRERDELREEADRLRAIVDRLAASASRPPPGSSVADVAAWRNAIDRQEWIECEAGMNYGYSGENDCRAFAEGFEACAQMLSERGALITAVNRTIGQLEAIARREAAIDELRGGSSAASGTPQDFADMLKHALGGSK